MGTEIRTWQIADGKLEPIEASLKQAGRTEPYDLEPWIDSYPEIIGSDVTIIGRQVPTRSGPIDLLGVDSSGNVVIVELKRDKLPREALAQAIDYASDVAGWGVDRLSEICLERTGKTLEQTLIDAFPEVQIENLSVNDTQRIVLVGFSVESSLERMIEWLTDNYNVNINAIVLNYIKTAGGEELLAKTSIISEEAEQQRVKKQKKFEIPMSDEPGTYGDEALRQRLATYLSLPNVTSQRIRDILLPACLEKQVLTREELKKEFASHYPSVDASKIGLSLSTISSQLGMAKNDFLRQVISYEYPTHSWEKDRFAIRPQYRQLVKEILEQLKTKERNG